MAAAKKLMIIDKTGLVNCSFNVRYEKMDRAKKLEIDHCVEFLGPDNRVEYATIVKNVPVFDSQNVTTIPLEVPKIEAVIGIEEKSVPEIVTENVTDAREVTCKKAWVDASGTIYPQEQIKHYYHGQECAEKTKSNIFEIVEFQPLVKYNNDYVIDKYYEPWPDEDGLKKEADKDAARRKNLIGMRSLWEYLQSTQTVGRGEFNVSSGGFLATDGYIRAISFGNKWGIEISILKEEKVFQHLQEDVPAAVMSAITPVGPMRIKRV